MNRRESRANRKAMKTRADALNKSGSCGDCTECCSNLAIEKLLKREGDPCRSLSKNGKGCGRYETRPDSCRYFMCSWRIHGTWSESFRPDKCGVMLYPIMEGPLLAIRAMGRTEAELIKQLPWIIEYAAKQKLPLTARVVGLKHERVYGTEEEIQSIVRAKKHLRIVQG